MGEQEQRGGCRLGRFDDTGKGMSREREMIILITAAPNQHFSCNVHKSLAEMELGAG